MFTYNQVQYPAPGHYCMLHLTAARYNRRSGSSAGLCALKAPRRSCANASAASSCAAAAIGTDVVVSTLSQSTQTKSTCIEKAALVTVSGMWGLR